MAVADPRAGADSAWTPLSGCNCFIAASLPDGRPSGTAAFWIFRGQSISLGTGSPKHRANRRRVKTLKLQRQRNQFIVAGYDVGQYEILDNPKIVPPANHVRREVFRRLRV